MHSKCFNDRETLIRISTKLSKQLRYSFFVQTNMKKNNFAVDFEDIYRETPSNIAAYA